MEKFLIATLLLTLIVPSKAQDVAVRPAEGLIVTGHAELKFAPDLATLTVGVTTQAKSAADAARQNAQASNAVLDAVKNTGINARDIQTQNYSVVPQYEYPANKLTGYQASNSIEITLRDLSKAGILIDAVTSAGANSVGQLAYDLSDKKRATADALTAAITAARAKADAMAKAADVSLVFLRSLTEGGAPIVRPVFATLRGRADTASTPIEEQQVTVTADVTLTYAIRHEP